MMKNIWAIGLISMFVVAAGGCMVDNQNDDDDNDPNQNGNGGGVNPGGGNQGGGNQGGGNQGGQQERADGTIGSSCGSCQAGLQCDSSPPGGYCTKLCQSQQECGAGAYCYSLQQGGGVCLDACNSDQDCRPGYSCQGDAGATVCYPGASGGNGGGNGSGGGSNTSGPTCGVDLFSGWWAPECSSVGCEQYQFLSNGTFQYEFWTYASGTMYDSGTWSISCPNLSGRFSDGRAVDFVIQGTNIYRDGTTRFAHCSGKCY
ncbi:MAG TPA: hypothetical protein PKL73_22035 [Polyangiaceae bacterium]|nr:MAG: hypothetical protein BWY17_04971 [Deltaproteobacteria bacterium ADurb.Bin207]HNS99655.1 hypothetical protein [Polyangiaceae bacterium]HNZ25244.1 hypothetical protein [Polyangiaceae bacterium]HOD24841.1 hypothetical protein [Polyangiaceae bacterium]HOE51438.1 hypothetical protein [Polyangiaceae bacterium]